LDVNVLLALFDPGHVHHELAHDWFEDHRRAGWASCPITENGFVRLVTSPTFANPPHRAADIVPRLTALRRSGHHQFWGETVSLTDERVFNVAEVRGHKQLTDVYLLGLARSKGGALTTFDRSIHLGAVKGATKANLQVISAAREGSTTEDR
jgi:hypothetical protein